jgi:hypothetical protein
MPYTARPLWSAAVSYTTLKLMDIRPFEATLYNLSYWLLIPLWSIGHPWNALFLNITTVARTPRTRKRPVGRPLRYTGQHKRRHTKEVSQTPQESPMKNKSKLYNVWGRMTILKKMKIDYAATSRYPPCKRRYSAQGEFRTTWRK